MRKIVFRLLAVALLAAPAVRAQEPAPPHGFELQKIGDGVYAAIRRERPTIFVDANSVFIINPDDVVVVDANITPASTRECLDALKKLTDKPVRYVINTHWHQDHVAGNQVYRDAFPGVEIISSTKARATLAAKAEETRKLYLDQGPKYAATLRDNVAKNVTFAGKPLSDEERESYLTAAWLIDQYIAEAPAMRTELATITVDDALTLHRGARTIEIRWMGRGHTDNDLVVWLPSERILVTGDLVIAPVPLIGDQSFIGDWGPTLARLRALKPAIIVPGHGPVLHDDSYLKQLGDMTDYIAKETAAAVARGETLDQVRKSVSLDAYRKQFTGGSGALDTIFSFYVAGPAVAKAYDEAQNRSR